MITNNTSMITNNTSKNIKEIICEKCKFKCSKKGDYHRHINTAKHKMIMNDNTITSKYIAAQYCECGKSYKFASGLSRHKNKCSLNNETKQIILNIENTSINSSNNKEGVNNNEPKNEIIRSTNKDQLILELLAQNKELISILHETVPKIGNNNTTTNNNNQFNLQVFLNEDCKDAINFSEFIKQIQVSFEDLENQVESGYIKGISKLFIESLQGLGTNKRPIHCTDKKRKTLYIKENDAWDKEGSQDMLIKGINEVTRRTMQTLMKEKEIQSEEYADMDSEFSMKCLSIQRNLFPSAPRETTINKVVENITKNSGIID